ncbi:MAG: DHA2 family efflux MFS transporter permease subunit [Solirubrobacterales bacterium]|nr:DHA2 family efflux MFS transporter permease subunit [Solirubrobacterales bacterium]OJU94964.1 MAG: MFS transporter [Solirubrobacterales bacterium 67-14]
MNQDSTTRIEPYVWKVVGVVILGMIMSILDTTIVNVALDTLAKDLHSTISDIQWVATGYLLSLAAVIPLTGWAARKFGAKNVYIWSIVLFTIGSALCGIADSSTSLIAFRVLQGIGGGMIMPIAQMIMAEVAGPKRMGKVMSITVMPAMLAPILGPVVGGLILQNFHWSWIFFVNVPVGVIAVILAMKMLPHSKLGEAGKLDVTGLVLMVLGIPALVFGISEVGTTGTFNAPEVIWPAVAGLALICAFVWHAMRADRPLLDVKLYSNRIFSAASLTTFALGAALFGAMILMPLYYQQVRGESVIATGLLLGPQGIGMVLVGPFAPRLTERFGGGKVATVGVLILCLSSLPYVFIGVDTSIAFLSLMLLIRGAGIGLAFMPTMTVAYASLKKEQLSDATPQMNVIQRVGGAIGTAVLAVVLQRAGEGATSMTQAADAFGTAYLWALGIGLLALIPCVVLWRAEKPEEPNTEEMKIAEAEIEPLGT